MLYPPDPVRTRLVVVAFREGDPEALGRPPGLYAEDGLLVYAPGTRPELPPYHPLLGLETILIVPGPPDAGDEPDGLLPGPLPPLGGPCKLVRGLDPIDLV